MPKPPVFIDVVIDAHDALPDLAMRWRTIPGALPRVVTRVHYEPERGPEGEWLVFAAGPAGAASASASAVEVEDSSAGTATLIWGGTHGLRLRLGELEVAEPYLVLAPESVLG
jgi:hypothetical protein